VIFGLQNDREWHSFCAHALQQPALAQDARFATNLQRVAHRKELDAVIASVLALSREQAMQRLDAGGIANAPLNDMHAVWDHPQLQARERWREVATPAGSIQALLPPATLSDAEAAMGGCPRWASTPQALWEEFGGRHGPGRKVRP
jgi:crotonobetainyl-CoA:carnitine CoA-transferase CaiB-like acyl-CoA transferase